MSKTVELSDPLPYPEVLDISNIPEIKGKAVYLIEPYEKCVSIVIQRVDGYVLSRIADWDGNIIDFEEDGLLQDKARKFLSDYSPSILAIMKCINIDQACLFISMDNKLVDFRLSLNKMAGPGMLKELFSKHVDTQTVVENNKRV